MRPHPLARNAPFFNTLNGENQTASGVLPVKQRDPGHESDPEAWVQALSRAEDHVRLEASAVPDSAHPLPGRGALAIMMGVVVAVAVAIVTPRLVGSPTPGLSTGQQASDLRAEAGRLIEQIEAYRVERGSLPTPAMLAPFLDEGYEYRITDRASLRFEVRRSAGGVEVVYDGSSPFSVWVTFGGSGGGS